MQAGGWPLLQTKERIGCNDAISPRDSRLRRAVPGGNRFAPRRGREGLLHEQGRLRRLQGICRHRKRDRSGLEPRRQPDPLRGNRRGPWNARLRGFAAEHRHPARPGDAAGRAAARECWERGPRPGNRTAPGSSSPAGRRHRPASGTTISTSPTWRTGPPPTSPTARFPSSACRSGRPAATGSPSPRGSETSGTSSSWRPTA